MCNPWSYLLCKILSPVLHPVVGQMLSLASGHIRMTECSGHSALSCVLVMPQHFYMSTIETFVIWLFCTSSYWQIMNLTFVFLIQILIHMVTVEMRTQKQECKIWQKCDLFQMIKECWMPCFMLWVNVSHCIQTLKTVFLRVCTYLLMFH